MGRLYKIIFPSFKKEKTYPEFAGEHGRARLVVLGIEVGGRWSDEAVHFVRQLAKARSKNVVASLHQSAKLAWQRRWSVMLSVAAQRAVADSLLERRSCRVFDGSTPSVQDVLSGDRYRPFGA